MPKRNSIVVEEEVYPSHLIEENDNTTTNSIECPLFPHTHIYICVGMSFL